MVVISATHNRLVKQTASLRARWRCSPKPLKIGFVIVKQEKLPIAVSG
jgi:hypothetical protein